MMEINGHNTELARLHAFLTDRLGEPFLVICPGECDQAEFEGSDDFDAFASRHRLTSEVPFEAMCRQASASHGPVGWALGEADCLCVAALQQRSRRWAFVISRQAMPPTQGCKLLRMVVEAWAAKEELAESRQALGESAARLGHVFEEQSWLRDIAENAADLARTHNAVELSNRILEPLVYLLRAQALFLIVEPGETATGGLSDRKYGRSTLTYGSVRRLLSVCGFTRDSAVFVKNNAHFATADGLVESLIAVPVHSSKYFLGCLVAINRKPSDDGNGLPVHDPEFGSDQVGLIEEAAVLLATQALNIHLLQQSNQLLLGTLHAMSGAIDARDHYTQGHSERVATLAHSLACIHGLSAMACQEIYLSGILHDIGKIGVPDAVLLKNSSLTEEEFKIIQTHPEIGYRIVERLEHLHFVLPGVLHHHERWDGRGYPHGLGGASIPLMARFLAVADAFDAMTSSRPYRHAMPPEKAYQIICDGADEQWDGLVVECFKVWYAQHVTAIDRSQSPPPPLIPIGSPVDYISQAILSLGY